MLFRLPRPGSGLQTLPVSGLALPTGSYLAHYESADTDAANNEAIRIYNETGAAPYRLPGVRQIVRLFDGFDIAEPGVVQSGPPWSLTNRSPPESRE